MNLKLKGLIKLENNVNFDTIEALIVAGNFSERNTLIKSLKDNAKRRGKDSRPCVLG